MPLLHTRPPSLINIDTTYLPIGSMRQVSRVTAITANGITGEVDLGPDHWVYAQHFPGDPIFPATLMIEAAGQIVALWSWAGGTRGRPRLVRTGGEFRAPVESQDEILFLDAVVKQKRNIIFGEVRAHTTRQEVATISVVLAVVAPAQEK